jgi:hypothetical protein
MGYELRSRIAALALLAAGLARRGPEAVPVAPPSARLEGLPGRLQYDPSFPAGGANYCAPAAAANGLLWLARQGFPGLAPEGGGDEAQAAMVRRLALLMDTRGSVTYPGAFVRGLRAYVRAAGCTPRVLRHRYPGSLDPLRRISEPGTLAWCSFGRYRPEGPVYVRTGGHFVTVAGYGLDGQGRPDPACVAFGDPSRSGPVLVRPRALGAVPLREGLTRVREAFLLPGLDAPGTVSILENVYVLSVER